MAKKEQANVGDLRVWWIPQVPMKPFRVAVSSVDEAVKILEVLANYDLFQLANRIKPDYSNAGGLERFGEDGWEDWEDEETGDDIDTYIALKETESK